MEGLKDAFSYPYSPNWQDASTQAECDDFDHEMGSAEDLAEITGSKAHHVSFTLLLPSSDQFFHVCLENESLPLG